MRGQLIAVALAVLAGAALPLQALINARLGSHLQGASWAAGVSALVSAATLLVLSPLLTGPPSVSDSFRGAPAWAWMGGILGAVYLFVAVFSIRTLGAAGLVATVVLGQMVGALLLDSFGVLHAPVPFSWQRLAGCGLVLAGVWLITRRA